LQEENSLKARKAAAFVSLQRAFAAELSHRWSSLVALSQSQKLTNTQLQKLSM